MILNLRVVILTNIKNKQMIDLKNIVECTILEGNTELVLTHKNGSKIRYFGQEAKDIFFKINGEPNYER